MGVRRWLSSLRLNRKTSNATLMKTIQQSTLTHLQEMFFDVCDTLNGESPKDIGYASKTEMFEEFRWKLEAIEADLRSVFGDLEATPQ